MVQHNYAADAFPLPHNDAREGYEEGSTWFFRSILYICEDATVGAARWAPFGARFVPTASLTYYRPANFGIGVIDNTPAAVDRLHLSPFLITQPSDVVALAVASLGSTGAAAAFGLYPTNPVLQRPDLEYRIGGSLGVMTLDTGGTGLRTVSFSRSVGVGLYWLGIHLKGAGITTMPTIKAMQHANGRFVLGGGTDTVAGTTFKTYSADLAYDGSAPFRLPVLAPSSADSPMPLLRTA